MATDECRGGKGEVRVIKEIARGERKILAEARDKWISQIAKLGI